MGHHRERKRIRLPSEAYQRPGAFLVTVIAADRAKLFGACTAGAVTLSKAGQVVREMLLSIPSHSPEVTLDHWVIMPDHIHVIFVITRSLPRGLPSVIGSFKSATTKLLRQLDPILQGPVWQRSFHDRVLRDTRALDAARRYVVLNPIRESGLGTDSP